MKRCLMRSLGKSINDFLAEVEARRSRCCCDGTCKGSLKGFGNRRLDLGVATRRVGGTATVSRGDVEDGGGCSAAPLRWRRSAV
eukprot:CAMPEP_0180576290 /NCGR_PEP_ID=MMETSP1037_2-20121125/11341_1 /TAXON_ID=632150 /ORGANISM="Azadinium spinosum, Strain 3D9" /LENGTH=83 /DNA_ID=CAMNT_0022593999 /DNA_START=857 /DNA_END=1108 /DNA_ORIENTATION=-